MNERSSTPIRRSTGLLVAGLALALAPVAKADDISTLKAQVTALESLTTQQANQIKTLETALQSATNKTKFVTVSGTDMMIRGANVYIQNGATVNTPANGLGNLILGYNASRGDKMDTRTGSHFLVMGNENDYLGNGGMVGGEHNRASGGSVILTGNHNVADGMESVILTGGLNEAHGTYSLVGGGLRNRVGDIAQGGTILGGTDNVVWAFYGCVLTGQKSGVDDKYAVLMTGLDSGVHCAYGAEMTGEGNYLGGQSMNAQVTGKGNTLKISPVGCANLTGLNTWIDWDSRDPKNTKPWMYHTFSGQYLIQ